MTFSSAAVIVRTVSGPASLNFPPVDALDSVVLLIIILTRLDEVVAAELGWSVYRLVKHQYYMKNVLQSNQWLFIDFDSDSIDCLIRL